MSTAYPVAIATRDAQDLTAWAEPNANINNDEQISQMLFESMAVAPPRDVPNYTPLLRFCDPRREPRVLLEALADPKAMKRQGRCDRCKAKTEFGEHYLWVPMGASVTVLTCCGYCKKVLSFGYGPLVWFSPTTQA